MATLYEYANAGDDANYAVDTVAVAKICNTFTPQINHVISSVKFKLRRWDATTTPGDLTVGIYATSGNFPTGSAIATGTYPAASANVITTVGTGEWIEISVSALVLIGVEYGWTLNSTVFDGSHPLIIRMRQTGIYTRGYAVRGVPPYVNPDNWDYLDVGHDNDFMFEEWGDPEGSGGGGAIYPSDAQTRVTGLIHRYSPGNYTLEVFLGDTKTDWGDMKPQTIDKPEETFKTTPKVIPTREEFWRLYPGVPYPYGGTKEVKPTTPTASTTKTVPTREEFWDVYPGVSYPY